MRTRTCIAAAAVSAAAATLLVTAGTASAWDGSGSSDGHGTSPIAVFDWHVKRGANGKPSGYFKGKAPYGGDILVSLEGPATCVAIEGNRVGFLYPVQDKSRPFFLKGQFILITGEDNGGNGRDKMGFQPGVTSREGCSPSFAPFPVTSGHIEVEN